MAGDVNETGNFTQLNTFIEESGNDVNLTNDYVHVDGDSDVIISKSVNINGNDHTLNGNNSYIVLNSNDSNYIFENINFIDVQFKTSNNTNSSILIKNCNFTHRNNTLYTSIDIIPIFETIYTGNISSTVKNLAKSIVGKSKDLYAARKLAKWVGRNIHHENEDGFYQSIEMTLERKY